MEDGSLLPSALRYMTKLRENEDNFEEAGAGNALVISIFCLDSTYDANTDKTLYVKELLQKLASLHAIIHSRLIPSYKEKYKHSWFAGGEGLAFGLHCKDDQDDQSSSESAIPHLRALVRYGPHPMDETFAIAMMKCISTDLLKYNSNVAIECWDVDDGQILLIEGSEHLPLWIDDEIGVEAMQRRVYVVDGKVRIIPPTVIGTAEVGCGKYVLSRREALNALIQCKVEGTMDEDGSVDALNIAIQNKLAAFCQAITHPLDESVRRVNLKEYLHTAAIVLPLNLARMIRHRSDLVAVAISEFCQHSVEEKERKSGSALKGEEDMVQFENLVYTKVTIPKALYAMLLTGAGRLPPPIKIPKHYKSMELNRIKRQCKNGGKAYAHFRHALEAGIRLALGFEWLVNSNHEMSEKTATKSPPVLSCSSEERVMHHINRIAVEAGGDGEWIRNAWKLGPNATDEENNISALVKCPVWNPEIMRGGISPISDGGKSVAKHVLEALKYAKKKDLSSQEIKKAYPVPRANEVDPDDWIDMDSIDDIENKMNELVRPLRANYTVERDDEKMTAMNRMMEGLEVFVSGVSDVEGVSSAREAAQFSENRRGKGIEINENVYLTVLHRILQDDGNHIRFDDIAVSSDGDKGKEGSDDLLRYFSKEDLDWDLNNNDTTSSSDGEMEAIMRAMDDQLSAADVDRQFRVPDHEEEHGSSDDLDLPHDDPAVIKANVLSNLLESLDAQEGVKGPVQTMLTEMAPGNSSG